MPELLFRPGTDGKPLFNEFADAIVPTEFLPGKVFGNGTMKPVDYCVAMAEGRIEPSRNLDLATIQQQELASTFRFHISQYLARRAHDWKAKGFTETLAHSHALNSRSKFWGEDQRAAFKNWEEVTDLRNRADGRQGVNERIMLRELLRRADMMVILENKLDALVCLHTPWPPGLIGHPHQYDIPHNLTPESLSGPNAGLTEVLVKQATLPRCTTRCSLSQRTALAMSRLLRARQPRFQSLGCPSRSYLGRTLAARMSFWRSRLLTKQLPSAASHRRHSAHFRPILNK
jgi:amidase